MTTLPSTTPPRLASPIELDWDALEIAVERNAPDTESYLDLTTGRVVVIMAGDTEAPARRQQVAGAVEHQPARADDRLAAAEIELRAGDATAEEIGEPDRDADPGRRRQHRRRGLRVGQREAAEDQRQDRGEDDDQLQRRRPAITGEPAAQGVGRRSTVSCGLSDAVAAPRPG